MLKCSLCPCFDLHVSPSVTAIVIGVAWGMLTAWTVGFSRWAGAVNPPGVTFHIWTRPSEPCDLAAFPECWS